MDQPGVTVRPIRLISGSSPFCETFFDGAVASKDDLVGELNQGWTVGKRLLQHERSGQGGLGARSGRTQPVGVTVDLDLVATARRYLGTEEDSGSGGIADAALRGRVIDWKMASRAFQLTQRRAAEENRSGSTPGEATSIFKLYGATLARERQDLLVQLMGFRGLGWDGEGFSDQEVGAMRSFLASRAVTIYGGTNEVQQNIIAKRVLGLPD
jgi:alkylation response protein AidB-like acyl-CoA dehydrogenase